MFYIYKPTDPFSNLMLFIPQALMENCWTHQPQHRPYTHDILKELQKKDVSSLLEISSHI